jgi:hypothetical protein
MSVQMTEVFCDEDGCGVSLGFQSADVPIQREMWRHNGCPVRIARDLGLSREGFERAWGITTAAIAGAYPEFPHNKLDDGDGDAGYRLFRARIAARCALESLSMVGFRISEERTNDIGEGDGPDGSDGR